MAPEMGSDDPGPGANQGQKGTGLESGTSATLLRAGIGGPRLG